MSLKQEIEHKIRQNLDPVHLEVINESFMHNVPAGSESHFKVIVVTSQFEGKKQVSRHRLLNELLAEHFREGLHALSLHAFTPQEWKGKSPLASPPCLGGSKKNKPDF